ncbi:hypothetical protein [Chryseobacterium taiwanense]|uniref:Uncharacterized protein n=1 Tax=Chryseobacterium taiwanense TaxID=363331 RepID=A0A0B4CQK3_9FLAO|nr:hypothetical protein [Chryseobacterium taiwanense]KIC63519.1 hypothetical protein RM51_07565 [Chryseobacterium taiwanense]
MKLKSFILIILITLSNNLFAYPITPTPLRVLVSETENIVYAQVTDIKQNKNESKNDWNKDLIAVLTIKEILQGKINSKTVEVYFSNEPSCPMPAQYEKDQEILVFLDQDIDKYTTHALTYGLKTLEQSEYEIYKSRILEIQQILKVTNNEERKIKTIDWLIDCAYNPITRWEGLQDLAPENDFISYYDWDKEKFIGTYELNKQQKQRLRTLFLNTKKINYDDLSIVDLITEQNDKEILDFLIDQFNKFRNEKYWCKNSVMLQIAEVSNRENLKNILKRKKRLDLFDENYEQETENINNEFINKL